MLYQLSYTRKRGSARRTVQLVQYDSGETGGSRAA